VWNKKIKKTIFTLAVNDYAPEIRALTMPLINQYAEKIGAELYTITKRKWPEAAPVYEKLQIYELAQEMENDWNIYIDSDTLIHPDFMDITNHIPKDTVAHNGCDTADNRWLYDRFFYRDGRHIGSCNWFTVGSDWCIDLWKPLDDLTLEEAYKRITPTVNELNTVITPDHLIDDYTLSRNIAKYGLKFVTFRDILAKLGYPNPGFLWHLYTIPVEHKVLLMKNVLNMWHVRTATPEELSQATQIVDSYKKMGRDL
jgi:glycosyltransferase involved in cell wall biosynthesis